VGPLLFFLSRNRHPLHPTPRYQASTFLLFQFGFR
jgi:hypothetical protein